MRFAFTLILAVVITCQITVGMAEAAREVGSTGVVIATKQVRQWAPVSQDDDTYSVPDRSPLDDIHDGELYLGMPPQSEYSFGLLGCILAIVFTFLAVAELRHWCFAPVMFANFWSRPRSSMPARYLAFSSFRS